MKTSGLIFLSMLMCVCAPVKAEKATIHILQNSIYHQDEVEDVKNGESWIAIIESNGKYTAKQVTISVKTVKDEVIDPEKGPFTGKEIISDPATAFLIKGIAIKTGTPIKAYPIDTSSIEGGKSIEIKGGLSTVKLLGKSKIHLKGDGYETNDAYQLIGIVDNQEFTLVAPTTLDDSFPQLIWAGDLNNDGQPDLLIDTTNHYNVSNPTLFLSKVSKDKITYHKVAERRSTGC
ncbi:MAG: hypothetical protein ACOYK8_05250 [Alphaproteobacteria bacterium]